jgi:EAL domain-containing protein (putative c-di-GMP-specific phosphodiesterase class I)
MSVHRLHRASQPPHEEGSVAPCAGARVLVLERDRLAPSIAQALEAQGYAVLTAPEGSRPTELLESGVDVVVVASSPGDTAFVAGVRRSAPDLPVVLLSADAESSMGSGPSTVTYVPRSAELLTITQAVARSLGGRRAPADSSPDARLVRALDTARLVFQPIVDTELGVVIGYEALLRTAEPTISGPLDLIRLAEQLDRAHELGRTVRGLLRETLEGGCPSHAAIFTNIRPNDLLDDELYSTGSRLGPFASRIVLEITERTALEDVPDLTDRIRQLRSLGYRIALDDLGAGYSSLTSFALLEPEIVKFDMTIIRGLHALPTKQKLVRAMLQLCCEVGSRAIAEGVETDDECAWLRSAGCPWMQGYLFARPGPPFPDVAL